jgi:hypothetical protein
MEEDFGGGQCLTKGCGAKGKRRRISREYYYLTPWSRDLEKLTVTQQVKKFTAFYGTLIFITMFTRVRHWSLT